MSNSSGLGEGALATSTCEDRRSELGQLFETTINRFWRTHAGAVILIQGANWTKDASNQPIYGWQAQYLDGRGDHAFYLSGPLELHVIEDLTDAVMTSPVFAVLAARQYPALTVRWFLEHPNYILSKDLASILLLSKNSWVRLNTWVLLAPPNKSTV